MPDPIQMASSHPPTRQLPDWLQGLVGANAAPILPAESRIGVDPHPRPIDQIDNVVRPEDVMRGEMPLGPGGLPKEIATAALGKAANDLSKPALKGLAEASKGAMSRISEARWPELLGKFGGKGQ